jgi:two-component system cell cycle sensor histidine kinase PleC
VDLPEATIGLHADPNVVRRIMTNLLSNAVKFTPDGGRIDMAIARRDDGTVTVEIRDTGIGMSPDEITKALQPFVQVQGALSRKYEGTGLGLSLVKKLTELHDGNVAIESTPNEGTTVRVTFPAERVLAPRGKAKGAA